MLHHISLFFDIAPYTDRLRLKSKSYAFLSHCLPTGFGACWKRRPRQQEEQSWSQASTASDTQRRRTEQVTERCDHCRGGRTTQHTNCSVAKEGGCQAEETTARNRQSAGILMKRKVGREIRLWMTLVLKWSHVLNIVDLKILETP